MNKLEEFLNSINMHPHQTDMELFIKNIRTEMERGLEGKPSSLKMIPSYIGAHGEIRLNEPVIAIDAGGTNMRTGLVSFTEAGLKLEHFKKCPMPGSGGEISVDRFFSIIAEKILPLTEFSHKISFCFSYPAEVFENRDGKIICFIKEVKVRDSEGVVIGETLLKKLHELGQTKPMGFTLLNDTTAGLMGGIATLDLKKADGLCGLVLGTGLNSCYLEKGKKIKKLSGVGDMIINCESGIFDRAFRGESDLMCDRSSEVCGDHQLEKMLSGVYHGSVISNTIFLAAKAGLLSEGFLAHREFTTPELDNFLRGEENEVKKLCRNSDEEIVREIIDLSFERGARLVCAMLCAHCLHCNGGRSEKTPFCVVAEGSTIHQSLLFKKKLENYLENYAKNKLGCNISLVRAENSTMAGAALAALLN